MHARISARENNVCKNIVSPCRSDNRLVVSETSPCHSRIHSNTSLQRVVILLWHLGFVSQISALYYLYVHLLKHELWVEHLGNRRKHSLDSRSSRCNSTRLRESDPKKWLPREITMYKLWLQLWSCKNGVNIKWLYILPSNGQISGELDSSALLKIVAMLIFATSLVFGSPSSVSRTDLRTFMLSVSCNGTGPKIPGLYGSLA